MTTADASPFGAIPRTRAVSRRAAGRGWFRDALRIVGGWLAIASIVALALVVAVKLVPVVVAWWVPALIAVGAGAGVGAARAFGARWGDLRGAHEMDRSLGLRDRLGSALTLTRSSGADDAVLALVAAEGERVAAGASPARAIAIPIARSWWVALIASLAALGIGMYMPERSGEDLQAAREREAQREQAAQTVAAAIETLEESIADDPAAAGASPDELAALEQLERELLEGTIDPETAAAESAAALQRTADEIERRSERDELADESLRDQLAEAASDAQGDAGVDETSESFEELRDAFESGDLERARDAARSLMDEADRMPAEQRERLAQRLEDLARSIEPEPADPAPGPSDTEEGDEGQPPSNDSTQGDLPADTAPDSTEDRARELEQDGMDPASAREQAQQEQEAQDARDAQNQAREDRQRLADGARESAERLRDESDQNKPPREPEDSPSGRDESQDREGADDGAPRQQPDQEPPTGDEPQREPGAQGAEERQPNGEEQQQPGDESPDRPGEQPRSGEEPRPGDRPQPGEPSPGDERPAETDPAEPRDQPDGRQPSQERPPEQGQPSERPESGEAPGEGERQQPARDGTPQQAPGSERPSERPEKSRRESLDEALDDLANRQDRARQQRDRARELRECANDSLGDEPAAGDRSDENVDERDPAFRPDDTPRDRPPRDPGSNDPASPTPGGQQGGDDRLDPRPGEIPQGSEPADFRRGDDAGDGSIVSDWFDPESPVPAGPGRADAARRMQEAADGAKRAIEQQRVPRKYRDLIQRVYERMERRSAALADDVPLGDNAGMPSDDP